MRPILQSRWRVEGRRLVYYGLRQPPHTLRGNYRLNGYDAALLSSLDGQRALEDCPDHGRLEKFIRMGAVTDADSVRKTPVSLEEAAFCAKCAANDYAIPGLELEKGGLCPMCSTARQFKDYKNVMPVLERIPASPSLKYDVAVFYTGGKDSSYLLYYLARIQKLRVLALCWETPFMSDWARVSIQNARERLSEVNFLVEAAPEEELLRIYRKTYALQKNVCICPSVAYVLFFERLSKWKVPYLVLGNEPAQCKNLIYNRMSPAFYFKPGVQALARLCFNAGRVLTLCRPFRPGQMECYMTVRQLAFGRSAVTKLLKYKNQLVENTCASLAEAPQFLAPFRAAVKGAWRKATLPALVHIDFDDASGGVYDWSAVKELLSREIGWVDAPAEGKGLHTSCKIERCKEWSQFTRFLDMESTMIPFSAIELSLASAAGSVSREQAKNELKLHTGFTTEEPPENQLVKDFLEGVQHEEG